MSNSGPVARSNPILWVGKRGAGTTRGVWQTYPWYPILVRGPSASTCVWLLVCQRLKPSLFYRPQIGDLCILHITASTSLSYKRQVLNHKMCRIQFFHRESSTSFGYFSRGTPRNHRLHSYGVIPQAFGRREVWYLATAVVDPVSLLYLNWQYNTRISRLVREQDFRVVDMIFL